MAAFGEIRDPLVGTRIDDRYLVRGVLGRGGMGVVYEGVHEQLGRSVAIKVLGAGIAGDPTAVQRFLREARTASQLTHGNIVDVSDLGQLPDGRPYLVMPKMHGTDLASLLAKHGPQTPIRTAELLRGAAAALDLIHAKGYVHRDVKPENLMHVVREDGLEAVLLLDFGIVGLVSTAANARLTADGSVFGTPAYLPPEVIQGEAPDPRADVYALATVAFELITGRTPFFGPNPLRILPQKVMKDAPTMAEVSGHEFPAALEDALARGLAREPKDRHASAGAFVAALALAAQRHATAGNRSLPAPPANDTDVFAPVGGGSHAADGGEVQAADGVAHYGAQRESGLDAAARARLLNSTTSELEMPIGASERSPAADPTDVLPVIQAERHERQAPTQVLAMPGRRRPGRLIAVVAVLAVVVLGWLALRPAPEPKIVAKPLASTAPAPPVLQMPDSLPEPAAPVAIAPAPEPTLPLKAAGDTHAPKRNGPRVAAQAKPSAALPTATELGQSAQRELIQGHLAAATELYAQATRVDPRNEPAWRGLGLAYERLGRTADAVRALRRAIQLAPTGHNADMLRARLQKLGSSP